MSVKQQQNQNGEYEEDGDDEITQRLRQMKHNIHRKQVFQGWKNRLS